jgi:phosphoglycerate dehydrogenase-like enzyme
MTVDVLCLRPQADFARAGALPPVALQVAYCSPADKAVPDLLKQARALVIPAVGPKLPAALFEGTSLKLVQVTGAGLDRLDLLAMKQLGIPVANVPAGSNRAVAEYVVTAASTLLRRLLWADAEIRLGNYVGVRADMLAASLPGLDSLLAGVVGLGVIGLAVAQALRDMGCSICYYDPAPRYSDAARTLEAKPLSLDDLLISADLVTLHVPLLPSTKGLIGKRELSQMKTGAVLIQASRGGIVDETALAEALQSGHLGGAAIDVYSTEPPDASNPLLALRGDAARRVLFTPHLAGVTRQSAAFLLRAAWQNVKRVLVENQPPLNCSL